MHFEQTNEWARFQQAVGRRVYAISSSRVTLLNEGRDVEEGEGAAIEKKIFTCLRYWEVNGGMPVPGMGFAHAAQVLLEAGKKAGAVFVRWTPSREFPISNFQFPILKNSEVVEPRVLIRQVPPKATLIVDLAKDEGTLLQEMHEKTRYNIRLAERKGVRANTMSVQEGFDAFWTLMQETARRDRIGLHAQDYYRKMLEILNGDAVRAHLFLAAHDGVSLATALLITCGDTATYLHGGSSNEARNLMAPHLLQWRMMQFAKAQGCRWYDMWGVAPFVRNEQGAMNSAHAWAGITRFKMGFGGEVREGIGTSHIMCRPLLYSFLAFLRRMRF